MARTISSLTKNSIGGSFSESSEKGSASDSHGGCDQRPEQFADLTEQQANVRHLIKTYLAKQGYAPSIRELQKQLNFKSPHGVICHLTALEKKGYLTRNRYVARSLRIIK